MDTFLIVVQVCGGIVTIFGFVAYIQKLFREQRTIRQEQEKIAEGQKCQLRTDMMRTYYKNKDARKLRQYEAENFVKMYQAYKAMGGNSFIDEIYNHVTQWDVES